MVGVLPKRRILIRHGESQGNRNMTTYTTTPDHNIQLTTQGMTQALRVGEHLRHVIGNDDCFPNWRVQFYVSPYTCTQSMLHELKRCFLKKRIIDVREESRIREKDFRNFHVKERMNVIKEIHECFESFFNQEENFNFSPFRRKLKFHIFSYLKLYFKISKI